jgi:hypothetical protein
LLIVVCPHIIAVAAGVFVATAAGAVLPPLFLPQLLPLPLLPLLPSLPPMPLTPPPSPSPPPSCCHYHRRPAAALPTAALLPLPCHYCCRHRADAAFPPPPPLFQSASNWAADVVLLIFCLCMADNITAMVLIIFPDFLTLGLDTYHRIQLKNIRYLTA